MEPQQRDVETTEGEGKKACVGKRHSNMLETDKDGDEQVICYILNISVI